MDLRAKFLVKDYDYMCNDPTLIKPIIKGLKNRLSKKLLDEWANLIDSKKWFDLTKSFLENHYDPSYSSNTIKNTCTLGLGSTRNPPCIKKYV